MNKEYMLLMVGKRLEVLTKQYANACKGLSLSGKPVSTSGAACLRSRIKRDICILELLKELLETSTAVYIENEDACMGFDKLLKE